MAAHAPGGADRKRRQYVVEHGAQTRVALWVLAHLAATLALTLLLVLLPTLLRLAEGGLPAARLLDAGREHVYLGWPVVAAVAVLLVAAVVNSVALTNRIFGPLARLRRVVRRWRLEGAWPQALHVRRRDFHAGLFEEVGAAVAGVGEDVAAACERLRAAQGRARGLAVRLGSGQDAATALAAADDCAAALARLERLERLVRRQEQR